MLKLSRTAWILFAVFLTAYFLEKYLVAAPPVFLWAYLQDVIVITTITAVLPFIVTAVIAGRTRSVFTHALISIAGCVGLSALGYTAYWYFTVSQFPGAPPVEFLAMRGFRPGLIMGLILIFARWREQRQTV
jgi:hypothetical protein